MSSIKMGRFLKSLSLLQRPQSFIHCSEPVIVFLVMDEKLLYPRPDQKSDQAVKEKYQKQLEFPVREVGEQGPECLLFHSAFIVENV